VFLQIIISMQKSNYGKDGGQGSKGNPAIQMDMIPPQKEVLEPMQLERTRTSFLGSPEKIQQSGLSLAASALSGLVPLVV
jgi:hypothetical protein